MRRPKGALPPAAYLLIATTLALILTGITVIYSASSVADYVHLDDSTYHLKRQAIFAALGLVVLVLASRWDFRAGSARRPRNAILTAERVAWLIWGASMLGLVAVFFLGVGKWGATRWLDIGGVTVQPSEYVKLGCLLLAAVFLLKLKQGEIDAKQFFIRLMAVLVPPVILVIIQPDMGTTISIVLSVFLLLVLGGIRLRWLLTSALAGGALAALLIAASGYRMQRVWAFLDPWADPLGDGYQIIQSLYAFGSGGLFGVGLGLSRQKFFYLPAAHTDFIFAIIGEELGLVGAFAIVAAFGVFTFAGLRISAQAKDPFARLMAGGLTAMIVGQAIMNMAAVTGLMPITGIPLPLLSYGGSSLTFTLGCIGLILGAARFGGSAEGQVRLVRRASERGPQRASSADRGRDGGSHLSRVDGGRSSARRRA